MKYRFFLPWLFLFFPFLVSAEPSINDTIKYLERKISRVDKEEGNASSFTVGGNYDRTKITTYSINFEGETFVYTKTVELKKEFTNTPNANSWSIETEKYLVDLDDVRINLSSAYDTPTLDCESTINHSCIEKTSTERNNYTLEADTIRQGFVKGPAKNTKEREMTSRVRITLPTYNKAEFKKITSAFTYLKSSYEKKRSGERNKRFQESDDGEMGDFFKNME